MEELDLNEIEEVSGGNYPEASVGGRVKPWLTSHNHQFLKKMENNMPELKINEIDEVSGGNMTEGSVDGSAKW